MGRPQGIRSWTFQQKIGAGFALVLAILLLVIFLAFRNMHAFLEITSRINHSHAVLENLNHLSDTFHRSIAEQRNYLFSGDVKFYADYDQATRELPGQLDILTALNGENPAQLQRIKQVRLLISQRMAMLEEGVGKTRGMTSARIFEWVKQHQRIEKGKRIDALIDAQISILRTDEQQLLRDLEAQAEDLSARMILSFVIGVGVVAIILGLVYIMASRELKERAQVEKNLRESERRYALASLGTNDGLWDWNLETGEIYFSPRWKIILGYQDEEIGNTSDEWFRLVHPNDLPGLREHIAKHLEGYAANLEYEYRMVHKDGDARWVLTRGVSAYDDYGKPNRIAGSLSDITDRKLDEERLLYEATHDPLTGMHNRQFFMQQLEVEMSSAKRYRYPLSFCMGDLDRFKQVNDVYGHLTGDNVLISFASLVKRQVRQQDLVGRFGGDEFCFFFPHTPADDVRVLLERIREEFEKMVFVGENGEQFSLTCTFGIAELSPLYREGKELIEMADKALYKAKQVRNRVEIIRAEDLSPS